METVFAERPASTENAKATPDVVIKSYGLVDTVQRSYEEKITHTESPQNCGADVRIPITVYETIPRIIVADVSAAQKHPAARRQFNYTIKFEPSSRTDSSIIEKYIENLKEKTFQELMDGDDWELALQARAATWKETATNGRFHLVVLTTEAAGSDFLFRRTEDSIALMQRMGDELRNRFEGALSKRE